MGKYVLDLVINCMGYIEKKRYTFIIKIIVSRK